MSRAHQISGDKRMLCLDMARQGYGWEDIMVRAQVSRRVARWLVLGVAEKEAPGMVSGGSRVSGCF